MISPYIYITILLSIQLASLFAQPEVNCPPGQVFLSQACEPCPAGTFRVFNTTNTCVNCPAGTFSPIVGVGSKRLCRFCKMNTFSRQGSSRCQKCPKGTVANRGASRCRACGLGFRLRGDRCETCDPGTFNDKNATLECMACPFSLNSPRQSTSRSDCKTCPPGQSGSSCQPCFANRFKPGRRGRCRSCPPGSVSRPGSIACRQCPAGTVSRRFNGKCMPCPEGTTSNGPGATRCRLVGSASCPSNTFENVNGDCERCRFNFRYNKDSKKCEPCPSGSASKGGLQTECIKCPPGQKLDEDDFGDGCRCPQGMFKVRDTCKPCPRGTWGSFLNVVGRRGCRKCSLGTFSNQPGSKRCKRCPRGTFSDEEGAKSCKRCPRGSVPNRVPRNPSRLLFNGIIGSVHCVSILTGCRLGSQPARDIFDRMRCRRVDCLVGTPEKDIGIKCLPCEPGSRLVGDKCKKCKIDEVSDGGIITSCTKCRNGLFRSFFDDSKCACDGDPGTGKGIQDGVCKDCPPGSFGSPNLSECMKCKTGSFANGFGNWYCPPCPMGTFADEKGSASCKTCPKGQVPERRIRSRECLPLAKAE